MPRLTPDGPLGKEEINADSIPSRDIGVRKSEQPSSSAFPILAPGIVLLALQYTYAFVDPQTFRSDLYCGAVSFACTLVWSLWTAYRCHDGIMEFFASRSCLILLIICLTGFSLRLLSNSLFNHHESWFEEPLASVINTGVFGYGLISPWRFSRITYILGPLLLNEWSLEAFRAPGVAWGLCGVAFIAIGSRIIGCSWPVCLLATTTFATMKWFTISAGTVHMVGWGVPLVVLMVLLAAYGQRGLRQSRLSACFLGIVCGMLCHEYITFQPLAVMMMGYVFLDTLLLRGKTNRQYRVNALIASIAYLSILSPLIAHMNLEGYHRYLFREHFESIFRHRGGNGLTPNPLFASNLYQAFSSLSGLPCGAGPHWSPLEHLVNRWVGLFMLSGFFLCATSILKVPPSLRFLCWGAALEIALEARFADTTREHRLIASAPIFFMAGVALVGRIDNALRQSMEKLRLKDFASSVSVVVCVVLSVYITTVQLRATSLGAKKSDNIRELDNASYLECTPILTHAEPGDTVYFFPKNKRCNGSDLHWMVTRRKINLIPLGTFEEVVSARGPAVVVYALSDSSGIPADTLAEVLKRIPPESSRTVRMTVNSLGNVRAISYRLQ